MDYGDLIRYFGSCVAAGRALRMRSQTIWCWKHRGIPLHTQYYIEACTNGALLAPPVPYEGRVRQAQRLADAVRRKLAADAESDVTSIQRTAPVSARRA